MEALPWLTKKEAWKPYQPKTTRTKMMLDAQQRLQQ
jgi:hypothetical protein